MQQQNQRQNLQHEAQPHHPRMNVFSRRQGRQLVRDDSTASAHPHQLPSTCSEASARPTPAHGRYEAAQKRHSGGPGLILQPSAVNGGTRRRIVFQGGCGAAGATRSTSSTAATAEPAAATSTSVAATEPFQVTVLGAGQDVGRSAVYVRRGDRCLLFDCGSHLGAKQARKLPVLNLLLQLSPEYEQEHKEGKYVQTMEEALVQPSPLFSGCTDAAVISHFHMDHCGSLPSFTERLGYRNPIAMTYPTRALSPVLLLDSARIFKEAAFRGRQQLLQEAADSGGREQSDQSGNGESKRGLSSVASQDQWNYTEGEAQRCMRRCVALGLHETWDCSGWKVTPYYAGHVLGAAMLHAELPGGFSVVYTGDFNTAPDRHLGSASIPRLRPDLLISECTYGSFVRPSKRITEREFCDAVHDALRKGGKVLIPVFAVGRAQELCMLLNTYWQRMQLQYPIYFGGGMTEKANKYYKLYAQWTGSDLAHRLDDANATQYSFSDHIEEEERVATDSGAFSFSHISTLPPEVLTAPTPMVLLATPGMLHGGLALKALKLWAGGPENLVLLPGYCVRGTIGAMLIDGQRDIPLDLRTRLKVACKVRYMSFSAHADTTGIQQLARHLQPKTVMLVHGEKEGMLKLSRVLQRELGVPVHTPPTGQTVQIPLRQIEPRVPVYVHHKCMRQAGRGAGTLPLLANNEATWECDDPALAALIGSPQMQRYLLHPMTHGHTSPSSWGSLPPYLVPPASLLFSLAATDDTKLDQAATGKNNTTNSTSGDGKQEIAGPLNMLVDFEGLYTGASALTITGCGTLTHAAWGPLRSNESRSMGTRPAETFSACESKKQCQGGTSASGSRFGPLALQCEVVAKSAEVPPRCLQLVALRYRHEVQIPFPKFQQLLHLFMEYMVQCRHAYEQQRQQSGLTNTALANSALATPEFCDFGENQNLRELDGGGISFEFLSLVAIHDGCERLSMQWADEDERRVGAASVFVAYFSSMADTLATKNPTAKQTLACSA